MPAYVRRTVQQFISENQAALVGCLQQGYAEDGFAAQYTRQTRAWSQIIPELQTIFAGVLGGRPAAAEWSVLLEYPLYRLRRRIDLVVLADGLVLVIECKVGADAFRAEDRRQVEEYALDLHDFHAESRDRTIVPLLWCTDAPSVNRNMPVLLPAQGAVGEVVLAGSRDLQRYLTEVPAQAVSSHVSAEQWDRSAYRPVPNVIQAATSIFAGHDVRSIANADADNLLSAASRLLDLIEQARNENKRYLLLLTGVPGSGKTLAGLHVVHNAIATGVQSEGNIIYLSGNTPLVIVLREALAQDDAERRRRAGERVRLQDVRSRVRARIQHINDYLRESLLGSPLAPPHEHVIVFDEAQRAWDEKQGLEKFDRTASEPLLLLELMSRHIGWCVCVCLVGSGQEINSGEDGVLGWGDALRKMRPTERRLWTVFAPPDVLSGERAAGAFSLGEIPPEIETNSEPDLQLSVPQRSYRSPSVCRWVDSVLSGDLVGAREAASGLQEYPIMLTRSLVDAKSWLRTAGRGERRYGLVASSGARRLRADGIGVMLDASAGHEIAHWYLNPLGDIRSSLALEVPANEYTCQGLELDFICVCWGGDLLWSPTEERWEFRRLSGTDWQRIRQTGDQRYLLNSYRVLLTRAREGLVIWVPQGEDSDVTRRPAPLDSTTKFLECCGARWIDPNPKDP